MGKATVAQRTQEELKSMLSDLIDQKLMEILGDPDEGLVMRKAFRDRLIRQRKAVAKGERGVSSAQVKKHLGIV
ncbi:MAG: hypothetical protein SGI88_06265 [Candidatus Hydrogenedentes bacterium]|nr:hypothetical protein [Candidatus Hydrogenedentota bacterium]